MSVQHGQQVGKFKVLDLLQRSVGAWSGWQGLQISNILQWPDLLYFQDLQYVGTCVDWSLASELGWFDQCSWLLSTPRLAVWTLVDLQCCNLVR